MLAAQQVETVGPQAAITAYETFVNDFENSPLTTPALGAIHHLYLDWATAERERDSFQQAIMILETATAAYPALEAETEERLLQTYLAWGESLESAGETEEAARVYSELQSRYPQFTAEAQSAIDRLLPNPVN